MFDFDAGKLLIIGLVALVVVGPKDLPRVLRQVGQMVAKLRKMAGEFQGQFMDAMKEADLQDLRAEVAKLKDSATLDVNFDPAHDVRTELTKAVEGPGTAAASSTVNSEPVGPSLGSQADGFHLPAPAEVGTGADVAAEAFAPTVADPLPNTSHFDLEPPRPAASTDSAEGAAAPQRRKILVPRRRPVSRFEGPPGRGPAPNRPRNIRPARRETADQ